MLVLSIGRDDDRPVHGGRWRVQEVQANGGGLLGFQDLAAGCPAERRSVRTATRPDGDTGFIIMFYVSSPRGGDARDGRNILIIY